MFTSARPGSAYFLTVAYCLRCKMAAGASRPKYTHYDLNKVRERERMSYLYASDREPRRTFPKNVVQCLQLDHVIAKQQPSRYRKHYVENGLATTKCMYTRNVVGHTGCVNAVSFSHSGEELLVSGKDACTHTLV